MIKGAPMLLDSGGDRGSAEPTQALARGTSRVTMPSPPKDILARKNEQIEALTRQISSFQASRDARTQELQELNRTLRAETVVWGDRCSAAKQELEKACGQLEERERELLEVRCRLNASGRRVEASEAALMKRLAEQRAAEDTVAALHVELDQHRQLLAHAERRLEHDKVGVLSVDSRCLFQR